jgi:hypothetical protein
VEKTNYHKVGELKQLKFILSQFFRRKVQNQGVSRFVPSGGFGENPHHVLGGFQPSLAPLEYLGKW